MIKAVAIDLADGIHIFKQTQFDIVEYDNNIMIYNNNKLIHFENKNFVSGIFYDIKSLKDYINKLTDYIIERS